MKDFLIELYHSDPEFISTYHGLDNMTLEDCVEDTWATIKDSDIYKFDFGYFTIDRNIENLHLVPRLTGFFIKPEFRNKETFQLFETELRKRMPKYFTAVALKENNRLNNFFVKMNGKLLNPDTKEFNYYLFKQENL